MIILCNKLLEIKVKSPGDSNLLEVAIEEYIKKYSLEPTLAGSDPPWSTLNYCVQRLKEEAMNEKCRLCRACRWNVTNALNSTDEKQDL